MIIPALQIAAVASATTYINARKFRPRFRCLPRAPNYPLPIYSEEYHHNVCSVLDVYRLLAIQILRWANTSADDALCQQPYEWACGRFDQVHAEHPLNGLVGGEWTADSSAEYEGRSRCALVRCSASK